MSSKIFLEHCLPLEVCAVFQIYPYKWYFWVASFYTPERIKEGKNRRVNLRSLCIFRKALQPVEAEFKIKSLATIGCHIFYCISVISSNSRWWYQVSLILGQSLSFLPSWFWANWSVNLGMWCVGSFYRGQKMKLIKINHKILTKHFPTSWNTLLDPQILK